MIARFMSAVITAATFRHSAISKSVSMRMSLINTTIVPQTGRKIRI